MLGLLRGDVPLKHARAVAQLAGETLKGIVIANEYGGRSPLRVPGLPNPPASAEVVNEKPGPARES